MKYEEAVERLKGLGFIDVLTKIAQEKNDSRDFEAIKMAIAALEREIPRKATIEPLYVKGNPIPIDYYVMCECGKWICYPTEYEAKDNYKYCPKCGNRIEWDWSDEE